MPKKTWRKCNTQSCDRYDQSTKVPMTVMVCRNCGGRMVDVSQSSKKYLWVFLVLVAGGIVWWFYPDLEFEAKNFLARIFPPKQPSLYENMVQVDNFWIDKTEVSIAEFKKFFSDYKTPARFSEDMPVVNITWAEAKKFAKKQGKRLCSSKEWLAAVGNTDDLSTANLIGRSTDTPRRVNDNGEKNERGILNLLGNVSEWVSNQNGEGAFFIGGYWYYVKVGRDMPVDLKDKITKISVKMDIQEHRHFIGFRCCKD